MTTDSEHWVRILLDEAAPEPDRLFRGEELRRTADDALGEVLPMRRRSRTGTLSVVLAVAAIVVIALVAVGLVARTGDQRGAPAVGHTNDPDTTHRTTPPVAAGPATCRSGQLVLKVGKFVRESTGGHVDFFLGDDRRAPCALADLPTIQVTVSGSVQSVLHPSQYGSGNPVVTRPHRPARVRVALQPVACKDAGTKNELAFVLGGTTYSFRLPVPGAPSCRYRITLARVRKN